MAFCKKCGTAVNHKFCGKCGEKVEVDNKVYWFGIVFMFYIRTTLLTEKVNKFKQNTTTRCTKYHFGNALFYGVS